MIVEVTQENINQGVVNSFDSCPIALAIQDKGFEKVWVNTQHIFYIYQPTPLQFDFAAIEMDTLINRWINDFDCDREVFPIQIDIDEEEQYATLVE